MTFASILTELKISKQVGPKVSSRNETIDIRTKINEVEMRKTMEKINKIIGGINILRRLIKLLNL